MAPGQPVIDDGKLTVKKLKDFLAQFPDHYTVSAYEGESVGICITSPIGGQIGFIEAKE